MGLARFLQIFQKKTKITLVKKLARFLLAGFFLLQSATAHAAGLDFLGGEQNSESSFFTTLSEISKLQNELAELEIDLRFLHEKFKNEPGERITKNESERQEALGRLGEIENEIDNTGDNQLLPEILQDEQLKLRQRIREIESESATLQSEKEKVEKERLEKIYKKQQEIDEQNSQIEKAKEIARQQFLEMAKKVGFFSAFIFLALALRKIVGRSIKKHGKNLPKKRQDILIKITNKFVFGIVAVAIGAIMFAQFAVLLPFLALLGTGLAFAVRDVISSFIAWFFIGGRQGFKPGDLVEIGDARGRVIEVNLIHTVLQETGQKGPTGRILQMPNKRIFEQKVLNFSKMYRFSWGILDFFLDKNSNAPKAREILLECVNEACSNTWAEIEKSLPSLSQKFSMSEEFLKPKVFLELTEKGISVKLKFFCKLENRHTLRSEISERFLERIAKESDIALHFAMA